MPEVDEILDSRLKKRGHNTALEYLVKWTGYPLEEATWEPEINLKNSEELLKEFHIRKPSAPRQIRTQLNYKVYQNYTEVKPSKRLFGWEDGKFDQEYLERVERKWNQLVRDRRNRPKDEDEHLFVRTRTLEGR